MAAGKTVNVDDLISFLNEALELDRKAISSLFLHRVRCSEALAEHPTIQISAYCKVGMIGVLNGLFGIRENGWGELCAVWDEENNVILSFERTPEGHFTKVAH
jgi:hypothetical protein